MEHRPLVKNRTLSINDAILDFIEFLPKTNHTLTEMDITLLHTHPYSEIFCCMKGSFQFFLSTHSITLSEGEVMVVPSGLPHTKELLSREGTLWCALNLSCSQNRATSSSPNGIFAELNRILNSKQILVQKNEPALCSLIWEIQSKPETNDFVLLDFVCRLCQAYSHECSAEVLEKTPPKDMDRLVILENIIQSEYRNTPSNEEIAALLCISKRQLSRFVRAHYGLSLHALFVERRLEAAGALLKKSSKSIDEIAFLVGFSNKTAFYKAFKARFGMTPLEYRNATIKEKAH